MGESLALSPGPKKPLPDGGSPRGLLPSADIERGPWVGAAELLRLGELAKQRNSQLELRETNGRAVPPQVTGLTKSQRDTA